MRVVPRSARIGLAALAVLLAAGILLLFVRPDAPSEVRAPDEARSESEAPAAPDPAEGEGSEAREDSAQDVSEDRVALNRPPSVPLAQKKLEASGVPIAIFRGRLVYDSTGQGVPWCGLVLHGAHLQDLFCITDEEGRFTSRYEMPLAKTRVHLADSRSACFADEHGIVVRRDSAEEEVVLRCDAEPTVVIDGSFPEGLDPATIRFDTRAPRVSTSDDRLRMRDDHWFIRDAPGLDTFLWRNGDPRPDVMVNYDWNRDDGSGEKGPAQLDVGLLEVAREWPLGSAWVHRVRDVALDSTEQAQQDATAESATSTWKIRFDCDSGRWRGSATLPSHEGVIRVHPVWRATGAIELHLVGKWPSPPQWFFSCSVYPEGGDRSIAGCTESIPELVGQPTSFVGLEPGAYNVVVESVLCDRVTIPVAVRAGETARVDASIACAESAGPVRGTIKTRDGVALPLGPNLTATLRGPSWILETDVEWDSNKERNSGHFQFPAVPVGVHELILDGCDYAVISNRPDGVRGGDDVTLTIDCIAESIDIAFRAFDDDTGDELESLIVGCMRMGSWRALPRTKPGEPAALDFPANNSLPWRVSSPGYLSASGTITPSQSWSAIEGGTRVLHVRLKRGWGLHCIAWDTFSGAGLAGATILVDGKPVGVTDAHGDFELALPARPASVEAELPGWRRFSSDPTDLSKAESTQSVEFAFERR